MKIILKRRGIQLKKLSLKNWIQLTSETWNSQLGVWFGCFFWFLFFIIFLLFLFNFLFFILTFFIFIFLIYVFFLIFFVIFFIIFSHCYFSFFSFNSFFFHENTQNTSPWIFNPRMTRKLSEINCSKRYSCSFNLNKSQRLVNYPFCECTVL